MQKLQSIQHRGKEVLLLDLSNTKPDEAIVIMRDAQPAIASRKPKSVLILTDVTKAVYNSASAAELKAFATKNTPYIRASATVGGSGFHGTMLAAVRLLTGRDIRAFSDRDAALDWLVSRGE